MSARRPGEKPPGEHAELGREVGVGAECLCELSGA